MHGHEWVTHLYQYYGIKLTLSHHSFSVVPNHPYLWVILSLYHFLIFLWVFKIKVKLINNIAMYVWTLLCSFCLQNIKTVVEVNFSHARHNNGAKVTSQILLLSWIFHIKFIKKFPKQKLYDRHWDYVIVFLLQIRLHTLYLSCDAYTHFKFDYTESVTSMIYTFIIVFLFLFYYYNIITNYVSHLCFPL